MKNSFKNTVTDNERVIFKHLVYSHLFECNIDLLVDDMKEFETVDKAKTILINTFRGCFKFLSDSPSNTTLTDSLINEYSEELYNEYYRVLKYLKAVEGIKGWEQKYERFRSDDLEIGHGKGVILLTFPQFNAVQVALDSLLEELEDLRDDGYGDAWKIKVTKEAIKEFHNTKFLD